MGDTAILNYEGEFALLQTAAAIPSERNGVSVAHTLAVLRALQQLGGAQALASIAAQAGLPVATTYHYVQALVGEGALERRGPRGHYALIEAPHIFFDSLSDSAGPPTSAGSATVRAELIRLQSHTGQIALAYTPLLFDNPVRIRAEQALGAHAELLQAAPRASLRALWRAPLEADPPGWTILACLGDVIAARPPLARIRQDGYAIGPSPLLDRDAIAAPVWRGSTVAGAVSLLAAHSQVCSSTARNRLVESVMDTAAIITRQLTSYGTPASTL
ncbi:helix-turn-helix domain-containing protein [Streptomyces sp. NPDC005900]|uniref:helix-turn-helix domain-containing protein n=1 Tax=Streptomyces sp. NPDC005900 TaxID=3154569 RepID=UPI0033E4B1E6